MSTIMNALRKVQDQKAPATQAVDPIEFDRRIVTNNKSAGSGAAKRIAVVAGAVVASGLAGVGITLAALSLWQANRVNPNANAETSPVSAPALVQVASARPEHDGETTVVVAAEVLKQNVDPREVGSFDEPSLATDDITETPPVGAPVSTRVVGDPEAIARLKARREARLSRMPAKQADAVAAVPEPQPAKIDAETQTVERAPTRVTQIPSRHVVTPRPATQVVAPEPTLTEASVGVDQRPGGPIGQYQLAETLAIEAELAKPDEKLEDRGDAAEMEVEVVEARSTARKEEPVAEAGVFERTADDNVDLLVVDARASTDVESLATPERSSVPKFAINGTTWHPHRQRRTAVIAVEETGETRVVEVREGQMLGPLEVSKIGPTDVTFSHEGKEIRRRIGAGLR